MKVDDRKKTLFLQKCFGKCIISKDQVNICFRCVNDNCPSRNSRAKLKLIFKIDEQLYHCWVCGLKGRGFTKLVKKHSSHHYEESVRLFGSTYRKNDSNVTNPSFVDDLPPGFVLLADNLHHHDPDVKAVFNYLNKRGVSYSDLWRFRLGAYTSGRLKRRVVFPSIAEDGSYNYWVSRTIDPDKKMKYLNSKNEKKAIIFNEINLDFSKPITLVEGPFDLIKCDVNAACLLGSELKESHQLYKQLVKNNTEVILALDADAADKINKIAQLLFQAGLKVYIMSLGQYADVGEMTKTKFLEYKKESFLWNPFYTITNKISKIKSGTKIR